MVYDCITEKLREMKDAKLTTAKTDSTEVNELKLRIKEIEKKEENLAENLLEGKLEGALLEIANNKAASLKKEKQALLNQIESLKTNDADAGTVINMAKSWKNADYDRRKAVAGIMIQKIIISENGNVKIIWNM